MANSRNLRPLPFSERIPVAGARVVGGVDPEQRISVTIYVRANPKAPPLPDVNSAAGIVAPLSDADFLAAYGASPDDIKKVTDTVTQAGLNVVKASVEKRSVEVAGPIKALEAFFGVKLQRLAAAEGEYRGRSGPVNIPASLVQVVDTVLGLDDRKVGEARLRRDGRAAFGVPTVQRLDVVRVQGLRANTFLPTMLSQIYRFPPGTDGDGQCIAVLCFNDPGSHGGYSKPALERYFTSVLGVAPPNVVDVVVHGQGNDPGDDTGADPADTSGEMMLDIQMIGGVAPKARQVAYFSQFTEQGWVDLINTIITDTVNKPSVISCSYGNPEDDQRSAWTLGAIRKVNEAFNAAALRGITICCASGDDGSRDQAGDGRAHVDFPASSPYVLGCGGTRLVIAPTGHPWEVVWNNGPGSATGGGVSRFFPQPEWQRLAGVPPGANTGQIGRGVPDVSGLADPETGVVIITLDGQHLAVIGGTSATAPLWAGLVARINQARGKPAGYLNPLLYGLQAHHVLRDVYFGNNGAYAAGPGWDACTGLGSPDGVNMLAALNAMQPHAAAPAAVDTDSIVDHFRTAYQSFTGALQSAWSAAQSEGPEAFAARGTQAYQAYLDAVKLAWSEATAASVDLATLQSIGQSLESAAAQAALAASYVAGGAGWKSPTV